MDIMPLCIHSTLMNCFNKVIFLRFYNVIKFYILSGDGKMLGLSSVSESQFRQRLDISPLCCNLAIDVIKKQVIETNTHIKHKFSINYVCKWTSANNDIKKQSLQGISRLKKVG